MTNFRSRIVYYLAGCLVFANTALAFDGGDGTEENPYQISTPEHLISIGSNPDLLDKHYIIVADVNMAEYTFTTAVIAPDMSISDYGFQGTAFSGIFDGNGYKISNLTIDILWDTFYSNDYSDFLSLFGKIEGTEAEVKNLYIENCLIVGSEYSEYFGGLCGENESGTVSNCQATGLIIGNSVLGGVCGKNSGKISDCHAMSLIIGEEKLGGLCGYNYKGTITKCSANSEVMSGYDSRYMGGLCGHNLGTISSCYANAMINGDEDMSKFIGGLCGTNEGIGTIFDCFATGSVAGEFSIGGLCGFNYGTITSSYSLSSVIGDRFSGGLCGNDEFGTISNCYYYFFGGPDNKRGTPLDTLQLTESINFSGFDFVENHDDGVEDSWRITEGHCPILSWQSDEGPLPPPEINTTLIGSGFSDDPFQINNQSDFSEFITNDRLNCGYYVLTTDIDFEGMTFDTAVINRNFGGYFEGENHVIRNVTIDTAPGTKYLGLFSHICSMISNLDIENITITTGEDCDYVGGLCGENRYGAISNCHVSATLAGGYDSDYIGGLCGINTYGTVINCNSTGIITSGDSVIVLGGLCGSNRGEITGCYSEVEIMSGNESLLLGGLCGSNSYGIISNCYAIGSVTGAEDSKDIGGLCGINSNALITNCYCTGGIIGGSNLGGFCGRNYQSDIKNCYATGAVEGKKFLGGLCGYNEGKIINGYSTGSVRGEEPQEDQIKLDRGGYIVSSVIIIEIGSGEEDDSSYIGGFCGLNKNTIINCFWDIDTSGISTGCYQKSDNLESTADISGLTTVEMQNKSSYLNKRWDFTDEINNGTHDIWHMPLGGGYPVLSSFNGYLPVDLIGDGSRETPYLISNAYDLGAMYYYEHNASYRLTTDIDLAGIKWSTSVIPVFSGCFDGNGHIIYNLNIEGFEFLGLFGQIDETISEVIDLGLVNCSITGMDKSQYLGGLCGEHIEGSITNCYVTGTVNGGDDTSYLGGICGFNGDDSRKKQTSINNAFFTGDVSGGNNAYHLGGLCGYSNSGFIINCSANSTIRGEDESECLGGLCGFSSNSSITNCFSDSSVIGGDKSKCLGGLLGCDSSNNISNCFVTGNIIGGDKSVYLGGLSGHQSDGDINKCYSIIKIEGGNNSVHLGGFLGVSSGTGGNITNCYSVVELETGDDSDYIGGFCGNNNSVCLTNCYVTGKIQTGNNSKDIGGMFGYNGEIVNSCYSITKVVGGNSLERVGGFCGSNYNGTIIKSYSSGLVTGGDNAMYLGGFCGKNPNNITSCFWNTETSGQSTSAGGTGLTTTQMQTQSTFTDAGWDFDNAWWINDARDYPRLSWQPFGDVNNDSRVNVEDLSLMGANWGMDISDEGVDKRCELSGDEVIDIVDFTALIDAWLEGPMFTD